MYYATWRRIRNLFLTAVAGTLLLACQPKKDAPAGESMPALPVKTLTGEASMANDLPGNSILILYSTDCDHCQRQAEAIKKKMKAFRNYHLYFISAGLPEHAAEFAKTYGLAEESNVTMMTTTYEAAVGLMGPITTPTILIYSKDKKLVKKFEGETDTEDILMYL